MALQRILNIANEKPPSIGNLYYVARWIWNQKPFCNTNWLGTFDFDQTIAFAIEYCMGTFNCYRYVNCMNESTFVNLMFI